MSESGIELVGQIGGTPKPIEEIVADIKRATEKIDLDYAEWPLVVASDKPVTDPETVDKIQAEFDALKDRLEEQVNG